MRYLASFFVAAIFGVASVSANETVTFSERFFRVTLPSDWAVVREDSGGVYVYRSGSELESLTVSVYPAKTSISQADSTELLESYLELRLTEEEDAAPSVEILEPVKRQRESGATVFYQGKDGLGRRFAHFVVVSSAGLGSFYFEGYEMTAEEFAIPATSILRSVEFAQ